MMLALISGLAGALIFIAAASAVFTGDQAARSARKNLRQQKQAQRQSLLSSINQEKLAARADAKANQKRFDVSSLLFSERAGASQGVGSTILAGRGGGGTPLLGSKSSLMGT